MSAFSRLILIYLFVLFIRVHKIREELCEDTLAYDLEF